MARKTKKATTVKSTTAKTVKPAVKDIEVSEDIIQDVPKPVEKPVEEIVKDANLETKAAEEIVTKAVKATRVKPRIPKTIKKEGDDTEETVPTINMYEMLLGRYSKAVSEFNNNETTKRPIGSFSNLANYVIRSKDIKVYNDMLRFFTLELHSLMANSNALNGIETITDPTLKTRITTFFTLFNGLASFRRTGRRPTFSINALRSILRNDRLVNWVNQVLNG
jgi:hypothetical protein